jgi:hypothetical protein
MKYDLIVSRSNISKQVVFGPINIGELCHHINTLHAELNNLSEEQRYLMEKKLVIQIRNLRDSDND